MQAVSMKKKRKKRKNFKNNASQNSNPLHATSAPNVGDANDDIQMDDFVGAGEDGFFGESDDESNASDDNGSSKKSSSSSSKRTFMSTDDGTSGTSTSGRTQWQKKHKRGKFSRKYKKNDTEW